MLFDCLKYEINGSSRSEKIEMKVSGLSGVKISLESAQDMLNRRKPSSNPWSTIRKEEDKMIIDSRMDGNIVVGDFVFHINNENVIHETPKYPRPSHADYIGIVTGNDIEGGGRFSGRMTAPICALGGIAKQLLKEKGINVNAYISQIGKIELGKYQNSKYELEGISDSLAKKLENSDFPTIDDTNKEIAIKEIVKAKEIGDSVGGEIQVIISGLKAGVLGGPLYDGLEGKIASQIFEIPAIKGVVFGKGNTSINGSKYNDALYFDGDNVKTKTNNDGGINGGVSNGMPITLTVCVKPTPSIGIEQDSIDIINKTNVKVQSNGRNDACIVPRVVPCVESATCIALLNLFLEKGLIEKNESIDLFRKEIDAIDDDIKSLFIKRLEIVEKIGKIKKEKAINVEDKSRENDVINALVEGLNDNEKLAIIALYKKIFEISKNIER